MKLQIVRDGISIGEIDGDLRDGNVVDGRLVWQRFPDDLRKLLTDYAADLEGFSLHGWGDYRLAIQRLCLRARGDGIEGAIDDLQVFSNGASLIQIRSAPG